MSRAKKKWVESENNIIRDNILTLTHLEIAELLEGRTEKAVKAQATRIGAVRGYYSIPESKQSSEPVPTEKAIYLAGHFDGEGCVMLRPNGKSYKPVISVSNAYLPVLEMYRLYFGGVVSRSSGGVNKEIFVWNLYGYHAVIRFLKSVQPFSLEKKDQIDALLVFAEMRIKVSHGHPGSEVRELADNCYKLLKRLKRAYPSPEVRGLVAL